MNIEEAEKSIKKVVQVSDGTEQPPARFNRKLEAWKKNNFVGVLKSVRRGSNGEPDMGEVCMFVSDFSIISKWERISNMEVCSDA